MANRNRSANGGHNKTPAQKRYIKRMFAERAEQAKENCDCPGCDVCSGFEPGCTCDRNMSGLYLRGNVNGFEGQTQSTDGNASGQWEAGTHPEARRSTDGEWPQF